MAYQSEAQLEAELVNRLQSLGWQTTKIPDATALFTNLREQLGAHNGVMFSDDEFARVKNHLEKGNPFEKAHALRDRFALKRDDGTTIRLQFFNSEEWCRNRFQVATQISIEGVRKNRYDVTLLVNGIPLGQIELKRRGMEIKEAFNQVNRYQRDSFRAAGGLFQFIQIFVISNGVNTRYYANNRDQSFEFTFPWSGQDNRPLNRLADFTDTFLERCHFAKMVAKYVVLHESDRVMMVLRPYQFYAAEAILQRVQLGRDNGHIWHTTGSGKTLTSFKAAQNLTALPKVDKVIFVVDRADLDYQTQKEFNYFEKGSVDSTDNTKMLVDHLADADRKLVITTIQKLNTAITRDRFAGKLDPVKDGRVIFIFDECHRSQFGDTHNRIKGFFSRAQMFGFTGTPILAPNAVGGKTTEGLFGKALHKYVITDAIRDWNVLPFSVEYVREDPPQADKSGDAKEDKKAQKAIDKLLASDEYFEHPDRIDAITNWIIANHGRKVRGREFAAIMAVGSVDALIAYYDAFERKRQAHEHDLRIATIFTYGANEEDPEANGLIPETDFPEGDPMPEALPRRDRLQGFVNDYNTLYGTNESVLDGKGFYTYYRSLAQRMKMRDRKGFDPAEGIDILLVVNMFLTGFDAKTVSALYVDKNLRWHGLIQAFSRTNRILNSRKSHGNIVCFRNLKERTDEAVALFANKDALATVVTPSYEGKLKQFEEAVANLRAVTADADAVDGLPDEKAVEQFVKAFREVMRLRSSLETYSEFSSTDLSLREQDYLDFRSKYLDLEAMARRGDDEGEGLTLLGDLDFELELIQRDEINVAYILSLLAALNAEVRDHGGDTRKARRRRKEIFDLLSNEISLRSKAPFIRKFIDEVMPRLPEDADVREAFEAFWEAERDEAMQSLIEDEDLDPDKLAAMMRKMAFDGKAPLGDDVVRALRNPPGIVQRRSAVRRVLDAIERITEIFDDGVGQLRVDGG